MAIIFSTTSSTDYDKKNETYINFKRYYVFYSFFSKGTYIGLGEKLGSGMTNN